MKDTVLNFKGQVFYIGIDVHKHSWDVQIRSAGLSLEKFKMDPHPEQLAVHLNKKYPEGIFNSAYEAGFCGFWIHYKLITLGINNIVVNPADIPISQKEKVTKTDCVDASKIARELEAGSLRCVHIQTIEEQTLKSLCRLRLSLSKDIVQIKNKISGYLNLYGCKIDNEAKWSGGFIKKLESLSNELPNAESLALLVNSLKSKKTEILNATLALKQAIQRNGKGELLKLLTTIPGIGFLTAATFITEIANMDRFNNFNSLASFVGLVPSIHSSGEKEYVGGLTNRKNKHLFKMLIEAAWVAVRKDPVLLKTFNELSLRMKKQKAIIRIAKKILNRIKAVWLNQTIYQLNYN